MVYLLGLDNLLKFFEIFGNFWKFFERLKCGYFDHWYIHWSFSSQTFLKQFLKLCDIFCTKKLKNFTFRLTNSPNRIKSKLKNRRKKVFLYVIVDFKSINVGIELGQIVLNFSKYTIHKK